MLQFALCDLAIPSVIFILCISRALECYQPNLEGAPLACPVVCLGGAEDSAAIRADLAQWANLTTQEFRLRTFEGGHFFLKDQGQAPVLKYLSELLVSQCHALR